MHRVVKRACVLLACLALSCTGPRTSPSDRIAAVETLRAAMAEGDIDRAKALLVADPRIWYGERAGEGDPWNLEGGKWRAWDEHFNGSTKRISQWIVSDDAVYADMQEHNDYYRLTESSGSQWRATYFFDKEDRILGFMVSSVPGFAADRGRRDEFEAWARANHAEEAEYLMPGGSIDPTGDRPVRMRMLLNAWRIEVGLPPIPVQ